MKRLWIWLFPTLLFAGEAEVIVHQSFMYRYPDFDSNKVQRLKKGDHVFLHDRYFHPSPDEMHYLPEQTDLEDPTLAQGDLGQDFYETLDRRGERAFIPRKHLKKFTGDLRELETKGYVTPPDETDYRLKEPLPQNYLTKKEQKNRVLLGLGVGPVAREQYAYTTVFDVTKTTPEFSLSANYQRRWGSWWVGPHIQIQGHQRTMTSASGGTIDEVSQQLAFGARLSRPFSLNKDWQVFAGLDILANYHRFFIERAEDSGIEERVFKKLYPVAQLSLMAERRLPNSSLALSLGPVLKLRAEQQLTADAGSFSEYWNQQNDSAQSSWGGEIVFVLGISVQE